MSAALYVISVLAAATAGLMVNVAFMLVGLDGPITHPLAFLAGVLLGSMVVWLVPAALERKDQP